VSRPGEQLRDAALAYASRGIPLPPLHHPVAHPNARPVSAGPRRQGILEGMDHQALGGYVVAPPSRHASGNRYAWARDLDHPLPAVLHQRLAERAQPAHVIPATSPAPLERPGHPWARSALARQPQEHPRARHSTTRPRPTAPAPCSGPWPRSAARRPSTGSTPTSPSPPTTSTQSATTPSNSARPPWRSAPAPPSHQRRHPGRQPARGGHPAHPREGRDLAGRGDLLPQRLARPSGRPHRLAVQGRPG
jgi:hypothetical protein